MMRLAVLINERDVRLGAVNISDATAVIRHGGSIFVRTGKTVKLRPNHRMLALVFEQTEIYVRDKLEPI
jgi:hypothetical protein